MYPKNDEKYGESWGHGRRYMERGGGENRMDEKLVGEFWRLM